MLKERVLTHREKEHVEINNEDVEKIMGKFKLEPKDGVRNKERKVKIMDRLE